MELLLPSEGCIYVVLLSPMLSNLVSVQTLSKLSYGKVVTNDGMYIASLIYYQKKKLRGVRWGERHGQVIGLSLPILFFGNLWFKKSLTSLWKCGCALTCWNSMPSGPPFSKIGMRNSSSMSEYTMSQCIQQRKEAWTLCVDKYI
jgi:hypothetical protein